MRTFAALLLLLLAPAWSLAAPREASARDERIARLDEALSSIRQLGASPEWKEAYADIRGVIQLADINRWIFPPEKVAKLSELTEQARASDADDEALDLAESMMYDAAARSMELQEYWNVVPKISWRKRWAAFATANGLKPEAADPVVVSAEKSLLATLETGRFLDAARDALALEEAYDKVLNAASTEVYTARKTAEIKYVPRTMPCPKGEGDRSKGAARLTQPANPDSWYPPAARDRGEFGAIILRARVAPDSCGTAFGVLVSSGFPDLDAAALQVAEASRYAAATENGKPVEGELTFKVRFKFMADEQARGQPPQ